MSIEEKERQNLIYVILTRKMKISVPITITKKIIFLAYPNTITNNPNFEDELHLEKSFRMIDKTIYYNGGVFYNGSYPKGEEAYEAFCMSTSKKQNIWNNLKC